MTEKTTGATSAERRDGSDLSEWLGPPPEPAYKTTRTGGAFDHQQMRAYAIQEREALRKRIIEACGSMLVCPVCGERDRCADDCDFAQACPVEAVTLDCLRAAVRA